MFRPVGKARRLKSGRRPENRRRIDDAPLPPRQLGGDNQNVQIVQTHDYVMMYNEVVHTAQRSDR
jgi:hypothetical protein